MKGRGEWGGKSFMLFAGCCREWIESIKKYSTSRFVDDGIGVKWNMMKFFFDIYAYLQGKPIKICKEEFLKNIIDCENKERIIPRC
jgi:hypothetical protein